MNNTEGRRDLMVFCDDVTIAWSGGIKSIVRTLEHTRESCCVLKTFINSHTHTQTSRYDSYSAITQQIFYNFIKDFQFFLFSEIFFDADVINFSLQKVPKEYFHRYIDLGYLQSQ